MSATQRKLSKPMKVDFSYAFSTPHRLTAAMPDSSDKTLMDAQAGFLRLAWSYDNLRDKYPAALMIPKTEWEVHLKPEIDGRPFKNCRWTRVEGWLPVLENIYEDSSVIVRLEVVGGTSAAMVRIEVSNTGKKARRVSLKCEKPGKWSGQNPAFVQPDWDADVLLAGWADRADRVIIFAIGGEKPVLSPNTVCLAWDLKPGQKKTGWVIRPYKAYAEMLPSLRKKNWDHEFDAGKSVWRGLIKRSAQTIIPDPDIQNAFRACLADCFVMREPVADGSVVTVPGTECYRAPNPFEPLIVSVLFDQLGLHKLAAGNTGMFLNQQGADGNWADPRGWAHYMWGASGIKSWAIIEHFRLAHDKANLAKAFRKMAASSRWQESQRKKMRKMEKGKRPVTYGLMPRGMGDGGLENEDGTFYGVFLIHNILAVYADAMTVEAARILGKKKELPALQKIHKEALKDLLRAMNDGAIKEKGYRWIPGAPGQTCGSRWGALYAAFPCRILPPHHELITGTIRKFEERMSPGAIPVHTGYMKDGMWVGITLDNLAEVLLLRGNGDAAARYLYATLNHGTPLYSWCEERGQEPGAKDCAGDRQHLWTPVAVCRLLRDMLAMEDGNTLHLARGIARQWLASGQPVGAKGFATHFGKLSYEIRYDAKAKQVTGFLEMIGSKENHILLHLRLRAKV